MDRQIHSQYTDLRGEIQTTIDECADGSWEVVIYSGSNFVARFHRQSIHDAAADLAKFVEYGRA